MLKGWPRVREGCRPGEEEGGLPGGGAERQRTPSRILASAAREREKKKKPRPRPAVSLRFPHSFFPPATARARPSTPMHRLPSPRPAGPPGPAWSGLGRPATTARGACVCGEERQMRGAPLPRPGFAARSPCKGHEKKRGAPPLRLGPFHPPTRPARPDRPHLLPADPIAQEKRGDQPEARASPGLDRDDREGARRGRWG